jgi:hypothetical protein
VAYQGIYRSDPPPQQPTPHVPIPAQGAAPPFGPTQLAVCMSIVLAAWQPPPPMPRQLPLTVAPLTLNYGQQPPPVQRPNAILASWQPQSYPAQAAPASAWNVPVVVTFVARTTLQPQILSAWQPPWYPAQTAAHVAPLTLTYGQPPPPYSVAILSEVRRLWEAPDPPPQPLYPKQIISVDNPPRWSTLAIQITPRAWQPPDPPPQLQRPTQIVSVDNPPPWSTLTIQATPRAWQPPDPMPQRQYPTQIVSVDQPPPRMPMPTQILSAWQPPPPQPTQQPPFVPIPKQGDQPPRLLPNAVVASWLMPSWPAQTSPASAWNIPPVIVAQPAYAPLPASILSAWQPTWQPAQTAPPSAGWNVPVIVVAQPPYTPLPSSVLTAWQPQWYPAQTAPANAGWNVPVLVVVAHPYAPLPASILTAWQPSWYASQTAAPVAPLALVYGQQPPAYSVVTVMEIRRAWEPPDPQPQRLYATQIVSVFPLLPIPCPYRPGRPDEDGGSRPGRPDECR